MSFLAQFLLENEVPPSTSSNSSKTDENARINEPISTDGQVLIGGSVDWDNVHYNPRGLNELNRIDFGGRTVKHCFSSSSALHSFFVVNEANQKVSLYSMGKNDKGQLGNGTTSSSTLPIKIVNPVKGSIKKIATGRYHTMILSDSGVNKL